MSSISAEDSRATRATLLDRLKDSDDQKSWQEFFDTYWQLIYRVALKSGLSEAEAQDAAQETLLGVVKSIKEFQYNPARCSFRGWIMLLTRQRVIWQLRKRLPFNAVLRVDDNSSRTRILDRFADPNALNLDAIWDEEWQKNLMSAALERVKQQVRPRQFQIFDLHVLQNWSVPEVARTLHISSAQVYLAKHRVGRLLKSTIKRLQQQED